ncbi:MAG: DUF389 domain-containing protein [Anaerolineae bacterium]|nr:DUF389 domain-containing protein [Anaerolineae bacterium]
MGIFSEMIRENVFRPADVPGFESKLFFEGAVRRQYLERFTVLLLLATIIASYGVIGDSTATVIGAMIIAPLMTPIMATAAALVMGQMRRAIQASIIVAAGVAGVIFVGWLIGTIQTILGSFIDFETNSQITARIAPRLIDLAAALASGAAGAFAMSRDDIADSLPGVAISISLVPPLCVVGISLSAGEWDAAMGSLLLFMTNYLSILLAGGGVLAFLGLSRAATIEIRGPARRNAFMAIALGTLLVAIPLAATGFKVARDSLAQVQVKNVTENWIGNTEFNLRGLRVNGSNVELLITGPEELPDFSELVTNLEAIFDHPVEVNVEVVRSEQLHYSEAETKAAALPK